MQAFTRLSAVAAPMARDNVDTDAIIPALSLHALGTDTSRFGEYLFYEWRFDKDGKPKPDFVLNRPEYQGAGILVAAANFGCGSSREFAVWALMGFGLRAVVAESFGDIFYANCFKNGMLPVALATEAVAELRDSAEKAGGRHTVVDLVSCQVTSAGGRVYPFAIDAQRRTMLLEGLDEIGQTLRSEAKIAAFQANDRARRPWVYETKWSRAGR